MILIKFELNQNVSVNMFEVDCENEQTVISRKLFKKDAECHIDVLRIDEDYSSHYVYKMVQQTFIITKNENFEINLTFANIVIMVLELKNDSTNIMIRDVWKLKDNK